METLSFWDKLKNVYIPDILESFAIAMAISVFVYYVFVIPNVVDGESMDPTFHTMDLLFTNHLIQWIGDTPIGDYLNYDYVRTDIVVFHLEGRGDLIKRVIGLPGEKIKILDGSVYINDNKLDEPYLPSGLKTHIPFNIDSYMSEGEEIVVTAGKYFVMGDNRGNSRDSRTSEVGFVDRKVIKGKVMVKYWPIGDFHLF